MIAGLVRWMAPCAARAGDYKRPLLVTAALTGVVASLFAAPGVPGLFGAGLAIVMLAIAYSDANDFVIPDRLSAAGLAIGVADAATRGSELDWEVVGIAVLRGATLAFSFWMLRTVYRWLRRREGIGLGDVKLAAVAGVWLDVSTIPIAIELAALSALVGYATHQYVFGRPFRATSALPFGMFLAPSIWFGWLVQTAFWH